MSKSLLVNISKYASSHQTSPIENFITETFAWLLREDIAIREALIVYLQQQYPDKQIAAKSMSDSASIDTQVNFNGKYPDMLWSSIDKDFCIIFEHKVWSELHENQLNNYREYATEQLNQEFLVALITAHSGQHKQDPDIALCWYQIAELIENVSSGDLKQNWLRDEFVELLKSNGLINMSPVNPLSIRYYFDAKQVDSQLYDIAQRTINRSWPIQKLDTDISFNKIPIQQYTRGKYDSWGRIGLEFNCVTPGNDEGGWLPGFFCGFLMDGSDHCVTDIMPDEPIAALIMDIDEPLHPLLLSKGLYQKLVSEISIPSGWKLSDRTTLNQSINPWHPLILYKKLSDFIGGATTIDQQSETFFSQMSVLQSSILNCDSFIAFNQEMHRLYEESQ